MYTPTATIEVHFRQLSDRGPISNANIIKTFSNTKQVNDFLQKQHSRMLSGLPYLKFRYYIRK